MQRNNIITALAGLLLTSSSIAAAMNREDIAMTLNAVATMLIGGYHDINSR